MWRVLYSIDLWKQDWVFCPSVFDLFSVFFHEGLFLPCIRWVAFFCTCLRFQLNNQWNKYEGSRGIDTSGTDS